MDSLAPQGKRQRLILDDGHGFVDPWSPLASRHGDSLDDLFQHSQVTLAEPAHLRHDPGGKTRVALESGIEGDACFSTCGTRRHWLSRRWKGSGRTILWVGMNPSTATEMVNDNTVKLEMDFSRRWEFSNYLKVNVMDYRVTKPKFLLGPDVVPCGPDNLATIRRLAGEAEVVVLVFGALHKRLLHHGLNAVAALREDGRSLKCLGLTAAGLPRHPLYMSKLTELIDFPE